MAYWLWPWQWECVKSVLGCSLTPDTDIATCRSPIVYRLAGPPTFALLVSSLWFGWKYKRGVMGHIFFWSRGWRATSAHTVFCASCVGRYIACTKKKKKIVNFTAPVSHHCISALIFVLNPLGLYAWEMKVFVKQSLGCKSRKSQPIKLVSDVRVYYIFQIFSSKMSKKNVYKLFWFVTFNFSLKTRLMFWYCSSSFSPNFSCFLCRRESELREQSPCNRYGRASRPRQDLYFQETFPLSQLDWDQHER